ncbi:hypothetical protein ACE1N8_32025 [Streptomyces sp. DSM 116494]|uniref:hypothetical protein n=1 Tax=Streptomyces TaxID=1883 RepID=UPI00365ABC6E
MSRTWSWYEKSPVGTYVARRTAEGKTKREIIRCLKRYVIREVYHLLQPAPRAASAASDNGVGGGVPGRHGRPGPRSAGVGTRSAFFSRGTMVKRWVG